MSGGQKRAKGSSHRNKDLNPNLTLTLRYHLAGFIPFSNLPFSPHHGELQMRASLAPIATVKAN